MQRKKKGPKSVFSSSDVEINFTFSFQLTVNINGSSLEVKEVFKKMTHELEYDVRLDTDRHQIIISAGAPLPSHPSEENG